MRTADVAIIGGGVIGCAIAWELTRRGITDVVLFERGSLAGGATGICPGGIRQQFAGESDCLLAQRSLRFYERINDILDPESPFTFERSGYLFLADSDGLVAQFRQNVAMQNRLGIPSRVLAPADIAALLPDLHLEGVAGGAFCAEDGFLEDCHGVTNVFARRARDRGSRVLFEEVASLERAGSAWELRSTGGRLQASTVVLAAGADSVSLGRTIGLHLPITPERRRLAYTEPSPRQTMLPLVVALERRFAGKQLLHGVFYLGWLDETAADDDLTFIEQALTAGATLLPELAELPVRRVLGGIYDSTPDHRPVLGQVPGLEGLHLAVGFSGHGFMIAPAVAEMICAEIEGAPGDLPLGAFSLQRFGSEAERERLVI
jgi:sarcosine oxidase, subunit beta